jgi:hypothetical protein
MKNVVFWDIETQSVPHRRHITSPLQCPTGYCYGRFEVFTAVTMENVVIWDITTCGSCKNRLLSKTLFLKRATRRNIPEDIFTATKIPVKWKSCNLLAQRLSASQQSLHCACSTQRERSKFVFGSFASMVSLPEACLAFAVPPNEVIQ